MTQFTKIKERWPAKPEEKDVRAARLSLSLPLSPPLCRRNRHVTPSGGSSGGDNGGGGGGSGGGVGGQMLYVVQARYVNATARARRRTVGFEIRDMIME